MLLSAQEWIEYLDLRHRKDQLYKQSEYLTYAIEMNEKMFRETVNRIKELQEKEDRLRELHCNKPQNLC